MAPKEYYNNGWAIHTIENIPSVAAAQFSIYLALRVNDNEKPLLASLGTAIEPNIIFDPPEYDPETGTGANTANRVYFTNEFQLLPNSANLPEFTNPVQIMVPNIEAESKPFAHLLRLDYIKQLRIGDIRNLFPINNPTDYLFSPVGIEIPWDSEDNVQWIGSKNQKYFDGFLNQCFVEITFSSTVASINATAGTITMNGLIEPIIPLRDAYNVKVTGIGGIRLGLRVSSATVNNNSTIINIQSIIDRDNPQANPITLQPNTLAIGATVTFVNRYKALINYETRELYITNINLSLYNTYLQSNTLYLFYKLSGPVKELIFDNMTYTIVNGYTIIPNTRSPRPNQPFEKEGVACLMTTGMVSETDIENAGIDNVIFYAFPKYYYDKTGGMDTTYFNYEGGTQKNGTLFNYLQKYNPNLNIVRSTINEVNNSVRQTLAFNKTVQINHENFLLLAITKAEYQNLISQFPTFTGPNGELRNYHIKMFKLIPSGTLLKDLQGEFYFKYSLVVCGLDDEFHYIQTPLETAKIIYSRDEQIFSSNDYAATVAQSQAPYVIKFERPKGNDYSKNFGFDWMRDNYVSVPGQGDGICEGIPGVASKATKQEELKQQYTPFIVNDHNYYMPWISMYKNHFTKTGSNVSLRLMIANPVQGQNVADIDKLDTIRFEVPQGLRLQFDGKIAPPDLPVNTILAKPASEKIMNIICEDDSPIDRKILAYNRDNQLIGGINISKNATNYNFNIQLVRVNFHGAITSILHPSVSGGLDTATVIFNFDTNDYSFSYQTNTELNKNGNFQTRTSEWMDEFSKNKNIEEIRKYFHQMLFSFSILPDVKDIDIHFGNYNTDTPPQDPQTGDDKFKAAIRHLSLTDVELNIDYEKLANALKKRYDEANEDFLSNDVTIFIIPISAYDVTTVYNGYSPPPEQFGAKVVVLTIPPKGSSLFQFTIRHEVAHALDLAHAFYDGETETEFVFEQFKTDNIMDYVNSGDSDGKNKISFWRWQWEKAQAANTDLEL